MLRIRWSDRAVVTATGAMRSTPVRIRRASLLGALFGIIGLALAANASAVSPAVNIGNLQFGGPPAVAVDSAGNAQIAWADEVLPYTIHTCTLPVGATACSHINVLTPTGTEYIDGVKLLVDGSTIVLLADVYGHSEENEPEQEWTSTDDGASFNAINEGKSVAEGVLSATTAPLNAVIVPGTNALGYAWVTAGGPPTFAEFPLASPPTCSVKAGHTCQVATLQPGTEHLLSNPHGVFAAQSGSNSGVLGVYETLGPPGCPSGSFDTAFVYGSGEQGAGNSYNISPGATNSAWKVALSPGDCEVEYPAVGGGPSGFGVVESNLAAGSTVYHRFDPMTNSFDTPFVTIAGEGEESPSVNQDSAGGVYATYLAGFRGAVRLAYSSNGGSSWSGPATLDAAGGSALSSDVNAAGQGWATWQVGEAFYAQPFIASDSIPPPSPPTPTTVTTSQTSGTTTGVNISVPAGTVGETDQAILTGTHAATASGTVSYGLYGTSSCTGAAVSTSTEPVTAGKPAASAPITTALSPGTYYWKAAYSGDAANDAGASSCGSEVLTVTPPATTSGTGTSTGTTVTVTITCSGPCTVTLTLTIPTASSARKGKHKPKPLILAKGTFTLPTGGTHKVTLHLTKTGRKIFAARHGRLRASLLLSEKIADHTISSTKTITITPAKHKHKHKK
jgi:hypothetical protein